MPPYRRTLRLLLGLAFLISAPRISAAAAAELRATVVRPPSETERIPDLSFSKTEYPSDKGQVALEGEFSKKDWNLFYNSEVLALSKDRKFTIRIPVAAKQSLIEVMGVSPEGEQRVEKILILFRDAAAATSSDAVPAGEAPSVTWPALESLYAAADRDGTFPQVVTQWNWGSGTPPQTPWNLETRWRFSNDTQRTPVGSPVLRLWVQLPATATLVGVEGGAPELNPRDAPWDATKGPVFAVNLEGPLNGFRIRFLDSAKHERETNLKVTIKPSKYFAWADASCSEAGIDIGVKRAGAPFLVAAAKCEASAGSVDLYLFASNDARLQSKTPIEEKSAEGPGWWRLRFRKPDVSPDQRKVLAQFEVATQTGMAPATYEVSYRGSGSKRGLSFSAGVGFTAISYAESPGAITESQNSLTAKINGLYPLIPGLLDLGGNFFVTMFSLTHSPASLEAARFYGINGRVGYHLPFRPLGLDWVASGGWYVWGMLVPNNNYGIQMLNGPQIFLSARKETASGKSHLVYLKFAPINENPVVPSLGNHELAIGASFQLLGGGPFHALSLTVDLSTTTFRSQADGNAMDMSSASLGLQTPL